MAIKEIIKEIDIRRYTKNRIRAIEERVNKLIIDMKKLKDELNDMVIAISEEMEKKE